MKPSSYFCFKKLWLLLLMVMVLVMISIGGTTRLTRSGLSMTEWRPVTGWIPPMSESDWQVQFELYQQTPEYKITNSHFSLPDYKKIFFWEYFHRLWGRLIFLFALFPGLFFWRKKLLPGRTVFEISTLIALQGLMGWLMVKTGLNAKPFVSPWMLSLHFFLALILIFYLLNLSLKTFGKSRELKTNFRQKLIFHILFIVLLLQILFGCLTSGLKAGFAFNSFPLMGTKFLPSAAFELRPMWLNFFENPILVQWIHRWIGVCFFMGLLALYTFSKRENLRFRNAIGFLSLVCIGQVVLGVANLILGLPIGLAIFHQLGAVIIFVFTSFILLSIRVIETKG